MTGLSDLEARLVAALDEQALVDHLTALVRVPERDGDGRGVGAPARRRAEYAAWGLDVDAWELDLDALRADERFPGTEAERVEGYGMVATTGPGTPALVLQGHVDVVPIGDPDKWDDDPFGAVVRGAGAGVLHGRGACDMKAGVAANAAVVRTLAAEGVRLSSAPSPCTRWSRRRTADWVRSPPSCAATPVTPA